MSRAQNSQPRNLYNRRISTLNNCTIAIEFPEIDLKRFLLPLEETLASTAVTVIACEAGAGRKDFWSQLNNKINYVSIGS